MLTKVIIKSDKYHQEIIAPRAAATREDWKIFFSRVKQNIERARIYETTPTNGNPVPTEPDFVKQWFNE
jgi:hypothetical protein